MTTEVTGFGVRFALELLLQQNLLGALEATLMQLRLTRPDDWHLHLRDGAALRGRAALHRGALRARHRHAEPQAAGDHDRARARLPRAHPARRCRPGRASSR